MRSKLRAQTPERSGRDPGSLTEVPLARKSRLLSFERRIRLWLLAAAVALLAPIALLLDRYTGSWSETAGLTLLFAGLYVLLASTFFDQLIRPLQTLTNIIAALREEDYSFRARGARRGDTVGDLALELNELSSTLQRQRAAAQDAMTLLERVLTAMHSPVLAFDAAGTLRLLNPAARQAFVQGVNDPVGASADALNLEPLLALPDLGLYPPAEQDNVLLTGQPVRWSVRRNTFRLHGVPHTLLVLSDVAAVLRQEERVAWQRLIRVLSHEINNSLTPIQSIAGSLRGRVSALDAEDREDFERGLAVVEERSASLNRFLQAYQRLTHLPPPQLQPVQVEALAFRTARLETRLPIVVERGASATIKADPDQLQQALINLLQNAVDAALAPEAQKAGKEPCVRLSWTLTPGEVRFLIADNGLGIDNLENLFVPFYTTKPHGSGIGLVLAQQIAAAHGGSIEALPQTGERGATIQFSIRREP